MRAALGRRSANVRAVAALRRAGLLIGPSCRVQRDARSRIEFGSGCSVGHGSLIAALSGAGGPGVLRLGSDVGVGEYANIRASESVIEIGDGAILAQFVSLIGANHELDGDGLPLRDVVDQDRSGVVLGARCWLGTHAIVLPGVTLGAGTVVGAGAVVTRSFPARSRLVGSPARAV